MIIKSLLLSLFALIITGCTPIRSSPNEEKHQMELTIREMQTNLDDLRHDVNCYQTELNIMDGKIRHHDSTLSSLKEQQLEKQKVKLDRLGEKIDLLEKKWNEFERRYEKDASDLKRLSKHAEDVSSAFYQYKERMQEVEEEILSQNQKFGELSNLRSALEQVTKNLRNSSSSYKELKPYRVKAGDSLEKIAKKYDSSVHELKQINYLDQDMIRVGQELKVPIR